ncbi:MAG: GNAT family N-acetyltransferase [bacterium]|nr:GNAT family N-acetyltransferase [bacterium]
MPAVIRRAKPGDEIAVATFAIKLFDLHAGYDRERFSTFADIDGAARFYRSRFDRPDSAVLVAEVFNEVVGFAYIERDELNYAELLENGAWLHDIFVEKAARSQGVGKALIEAAAAVARELGAKKLLLTVADKNLSGQRFFSNAGFRQTMIEMTLNLSDSSND